MTVDKKISGRVSKLLKSLRLTQEQVARVLDIPRTAVSDIETGKRDVTAHELYMICALTHVSPNEVLGWETPKARIKDDL